MNSGELDALAGDAESDLVQLTDTDPDGAVGSDAGSDEAPPEVVTSNDTDSGDGHSDSDTQLVTDSAGDFLDANADAEPTPDTDTGIRTPCPTGLVDDERGVISGDGFPSRWTSAGCTSELHVLVMPAGSEWQVRVSGLESEDVVRALTPHRLPPRRLAGEQELGSSAAASEGDVGLRVSPLVSGEVAIEIALEESRTYEILAECMVGCDLETTRYPITLFHGYAGTDSYFGVLDYFFGVVPLLSDTGYEVTAPTSSPIAQSETRAGQLAEQLQAWLDESGARKMNIIAHSRGGLDARLLVSGKGWDDRVASITTVATPHRGIPLLLANFLSVQDFSPDYMDVFNVAYPNIPGVRYWSWSSRSCGILEPWCIADKNGEVVDVLLGASYTLLLRFGPNDGIVPTASMIWGEHLGELAADHFDEVGQIADLSLPGDPFRHRDFYRNEARRLAGAGL
jgi:triacylglycerol lipase